MKRIHLLLVTLALFCTPGPAAPAGDDRAAETMEAARSALGGPRLEALTSLSAEGAFRRLLGEREMEGELVVEIALPGRIRRTEHTGFARGTAFTRTTGLDGATFWSDSANRDGALSERLGGAGRTPPSDADRERFFALQERQLRRELDRYLLVLLLRTTSPPKYAGTADSPDGRADVIEVAGHDGAPLRLFVDRQTHLPLMLAYRDVMPLIIRRGARPARRDPEQTREMMEDAPREAAMELRLEDYRDVDGIKLPHRLTRTAGGAPVEEWTIERFTVNPKFKPETFQKP